MTQNELKQLLHYEPNTGIFTKIKTGKVMGTFDNGYITIMVKKQRYKAHRLAWFYVYGEWPKNWIDHINGIRNDNKIKNLREVTYSQNSLNRKKLELTKSNCKNVTYHNKSKKWRVRCQINGIRKSFGLFDNLEFAKLVADEVMDKYHGQFART